jgi:hypothetical protein
MTKLTVAFRNFANAPKEIHQINCEAFGNVVPILYKAIILMYFAIKPSAQNTKELGFTCGYLLITIYVTHKNIKVLKINMR